MQETKFAEVTGAVAGKGSEEVKAKAKEESEKPLQGAEKAKVEATLVLRTETTHTRAHRCTQGSIRASSAETCPNRSATRSHVDRSLHPRGAKATRRPEEKATVAAKVNTAVGKAKLTAEKTTATAMPCGRRTHN